MKTISKIKPYNELYCHNAYCSLVISILKKYNEDYMKIITNDVFEYGTQMTSNELILNKKSYSLNTIDEILNSCNIRRNRYAHIDNIKNIICNGIEDGQPAIVPTDSYYIPGSRSFNRQHCFGYTLIFGYNREKKTNKIIMQYDNNRNSYKKEIVDLRCILKACVSGMRYKMGCVDLYVRNKTNSTAKLIKYKEYIVSEYPKNTEHLYNLVKLKDGIRYYVENNILRENVRQTKQMIKNITQSIYIEKYRIDKIFGDIDLILMLDKIIENWKNILTVIFMDINNHDIIMSI